MEEPRLNLRGDADSTIGDFESHDYRIGQLLLEEGLNRHVALVRKLDRIPDEVREDLAKPPGVAAQPGRDGRMHQAGDFQSLRLRPFCELSQDIFHGGAEVEVDTFQFQLAGFDFAVFENVVDQAQEGFAALPNGFDIGLLLFRRLRIHQ